MEHVSKMLGLGLKDPVAAPISTGQKERDPLREYAEKAWPAKNGHKAGCCAYYSVENCPCRSERWAPSSAGNYPSNPNPPGRDIECRDRL